MEAVIEQLKQSPRLSLYADKIHEILEAEREARGRYYDMVTEDEKIEFINGEVIVQSPAKLRHGKAVGFLYRLLSTYVDLHDLGFVGPDHFLISLSRNDYEPDLAFFNREIAATFQPDQMHFPAPDFVVEVLSESTAARDRGVKFDDYAAHGVAEYWIVDPEQETVEQYVLQDDAYQLRVKMNSGEVASSVVTGFDIPVRAIFDEAENLNSLQQILTR